MNKRFNKIRRGDKITSTSDTTIDDIVEYVAQDIVNGSCRKSTERVVRETVRPCAIGSVPTVIAGRGGCVGITPTNGCGCPNGLANAGTGFSSDRCTSGIPGEVGDMITKTFDKHASPDIATHSKWYNLVLQNGEVWTPYTNRRFLPAQYMALMEQFKGNVDAAIARRYSMKECFKLLENEIANLIFMEKEYRTAFNERSMFLTVKTCKKIFEEYLDGLDKNINDRSKCTFTKRTGTFWRNIQGYGRVDLWKQTEIKKEGDNGAASVTVSIDPLDWLVTLNENIARCRRRLNSVSTYKNALDFVKDMPHVSMGTFKDGEGNIRYWLPKAWKEAFKKEGAYYTLKSLVVNKHVRYTTEGGDWRRRKQEVSNTAAEGLNRMLELRNADTPAYVVHAILKKSIESSGFDLSGFLRAIHRRR